MEFGKQTQEKPKKKEFERDRRKEKKEIRTDYG